MDREARRLLMVEDQIVGRGVSDRRVAAAMRTVPREWFVPPEHAEEAYEDHPLPIGHGQTISQPYVVALMAEAAEVGPEDRVLEVGAGSGYGAAVLSQLAAHVWTIERHGPLARTAQDALEAAKIQNVHVLHADGTRGWPEAAPYDAIVVTAAGDEVPSALLDQLGEGGRLVMPVGGSGAQELLRITRSDGDFQRENLGAVRFVPLLPEIADGGPPAG
jgi:protein-L-isoaspartate(D-aspartate) O-methyltransferase